MKRRTGETGEVTTTVLVLPIVLTLILLPIQVALHLHADAVIEAAAADGVRAAQRGESASGAALASIVRNNGGGLIESPRVTVTSDGEQITVVVRSGVTSVVPLFERDVRATASGPVERFVPEPRR